MKSLLGEKVRKVHIPKPLKQIAGENIEIDDKELGKKIINPCYFTVRMLNIGFNINPESHHINRAKSKKTIKPNFPESGV